eukprot:COSAG06_NODE_11642_length_1482_cov_3.249458_2_plen_171_part_00
MRYMESRVAIDGAGKSTTSLAATSVCSHAATFMPIHDNYALGRIVRKSDSCANDRLPITVYPSSFVKNDMANMGVSTGGSGSRTYKYYKNEFGAPLFRFGSGLNYVRFSLQSVHTMERQQHELDEEAATVATSITSEPTIISTQKNGTFSMWVTNHGESFSRTINVDLHL